jgi:large subunit ribosomal protein L18
MKISRNKARLHRKRRIRAKIKGTKERPRFSVFRSLKNIYIQVIDDGSGKTLASADSRKVKAKNGIDMGEKLGEMAAKKCIDLKIKGVVFDRSGYKYHGQVKAMADGARKGGLDL